LADLPKAQRKFLAVNDLCDALILSTANKGWQKVAKIIGRVEERAGDGNKFFRDRGPHLRSR
jgi:hypothetical protein